MKYHVEKMASAAWNVGNKAAWTGLKLAKMDGVMSQLLSTVIPSRYEAFWGNAADRYQKDREEMIVRDLGKVTAMAFRGDIAIDYKELDPVWQKVKQGESGVRFEDVHDPHTAILLHNITPNLVNGASSEEVKQL